MRNHKKLCILMFFVGTILLFALAGYGLFYTSFSSGKDHSYIYIDKDDNIDSVKTKLQNAAKPHQMLGFNILAHTTKYTQSIKTGKYETGNGINTLTLITNLRNKNQVPVRLLVPNARTLERLAARIAKDIAPDSTELMQVFLDSAICKQYNHTPSTISCLLLPNTYEVYWDITPLQFMDRMQKESERFWNTERLEKTKQLGLNTTEVITLASIVDQETANNGEKPAIAGLYLNRLRRGMLLQADPTVKFAMRQFGLRRIRQKHLKVDSPYNTYLYKGLPPGPISIPSMASIEAVLNAEKNSYIYMCAKEDFSGTHNFASSYSEHLRNARKYTRALNKRGIK